MRSFTTTRYWRCYELLPENIQRLADECYARFRTNPFHSSLWFKPVVGDVWSVRVGRGYRALGRREGELIRWFWIGPHGEYDALLRRL